MTPNLETRRVKEAIELQVTAVHTYAAKLSGQDVDALDEDLVQLERAVADLRGIIEALPHRPRKAESAGAPPASPSTTRGERGAKGAATADATQRRGE